jgi:hypothetical protein
MDTDNGDVSIMGDTVQLLLWWFIFSYAPPFLH